ncbi:Por secretion system C-terminal sorting domain-containing protein [Hymenobacter daecheongensis DSM 21074]|uniref:Por secretion system C-terminal sorting domain-containing protein n=1 Tax=Hymenobacter daecheongensis DSM 21074 TaxID=1121955 RepID=A0A1M6LC71_9BACT|nr:T9SS-dependent M36 family metallopeptidase [Hymenobacter daecheongensis]SHJ68850.1 Por secretion system C-terminal sorting domain-containing protein [Hymenobacter daecheongensis DSM 21074]
MKSTSTTSGYRALALAALLAVPALGSAQNAPLSRALTQLSAQRTQLGLSEADLSNPAVTNQYTDAHNGLTHIYLRQRHAGIEVLNAVADAHVARDGKITALHSSFLPNVATSARATTPTLTPAQAVAAAARALQVAAPTSLRAEQEKTPAEGLTFNDGGISQENIKAKLMYLPTASGELQLVYDVLLWPLASDDVWAVRIDARTGAFVNKISYTTHEPVTFSQLTERALKTPNWPEVVPATASKVSVPNSYNVWPITIESPIHGARQVVVAPANATASPFGWHDDNGIAGPEYTITRGNNVHAYDDRANRNLYIPGQNVSPDGGTNLEFNFPYDAAQRPVGNLSAAVVNLFYWNNIMHDVMQVKGFTEAAANFQQKNYTNLGLGTDQVKAEAQDGAGTNNANFATPPDGTRGKMQMFTWSAAPGTLIVTAPASVAGTYPAGLADFGRTVNSLGSTYRGNLVLVNDGSTKPSRGCNGPLLNPTALNGNVAVIDRGKCTFASKVKFAQDAGARMAVIVDSLVTATPNGMTGAAPDSIGIRIPSVFVTKAIGDQLKAILAGGGTVTVGATGGAGPDGDFDSGIVAHEYGHGISNRLTGGGTGACLGNAEQMGEGWSDFFGLWMTTKPGDVGTTPRGIGNYVVNLPVNGAGIRRKPYTTDFRQNDHTYAYVGSQYTETHDIGEVWATVLWDLNWAFINQYGYNANLTAATGGNNKCLQLVLDGCKIQKCSPGFLDGRDAILKADSINNNHANSGLIWQVFARRGMGFNAVQGSSNSLTDNRAGFSLPPNVTLSAKNAINENLLEVYPNPAQDQLTVRTQVNSSVPVQVTLLTVMGKTVQTTSVPAARMQQEGIRLNTTELANGLYVVRLKTSEGTITKKVMVQH